MNFSVYYDNLSKEEKFMYREKCSIINMDPETIKDQHRSKIEDFPKVLYPDILSSAY